MKIRITLKDPDGVDHAVQEIMDVAIVKMMDALPGYNLDSAIEEFRENILDDIEPWVEYGEYVTIEIDTESREARVVSA